MINNTSEIEMAFAIRATQYLDDHHCVVTLLFTGEPGSGKTKASETIFYAFTESQLSISDAIEKGTYIIYCCNQSTQVEKLTFGISIQGMLERDKGKDVQVITKGILIKALEMSQKGKVVLCIDELDKADSGLDAFLLEFLQFFRISDPIYGTIYGKKENCIVIITSNEERTISAPVQSRCRKVRILYPDNKEMFIRLKSIYPKIENKLALDVIKYFSEVRKLDLAFPPTIREMMTIIDDYPVLKDINDHHYIIANRMSIHAEDVEKIKKNNLFLKFIKN